MDLKFWERIKNVYVEGIAVDSLTLLLILSINTLEIGNYALRYCVQPE